LAAGFTLALRVATFGGCTTRRLEECARLLRLARFAGGWFFAVGGAVANAGTRVSPKATSSESNFLILLLYVRGQRVCEQ